MHTLDLISSHEQPPGLHDDATIIESLLRVAERSDEPKTCSPEPLSLPFSDVSNIPVFRNTVWSVVDRLYQASQFADDCENSRWQFAVDLSQLWAMGLRPEELLWLLKKNVLQLWRDNSVGTPHDSSSSNRGIKFPADACVVITDFGIEVVEQCLTTRQLNQSSGLRSTFPDSLDEKVVRPTWDTERHELSCGGQVVKKFKWRANNQEAILAAFEEDGWPAHIDDPLPQQADIDPKRRLADAIKSLNRHQKSSLIRFCGDGTGEGVLWEFKR